MDRPEDTLADEKRRMTAAPRAGEAELVDAIVAKIRCVTRARTLEHALEIGEIVAQGAYEGNLQAIRDRGETHFLYRRVAAHAELPFDAKRLWLCVKLFELCQIFPELRRGSYLGIAHLRVVLNLPHEVQVRLLASAESEGWTSERLEEEASSFRRKPASRGRPPVVALYRAVQRLEQIAAHVQDEMARRARGKLSAERAVIARESLRRVRRYLDAIEAELEHCMEARTRGAT